MTVSVNTTNNFITIIIPCPSPLLTDLHILCGFRENIDLKKLKFLFF
jgi:hypothetical protein